jgi:ABC-type branched-subunit amino acid transport system permease subunit
MRRSLRLPLVSAVSAVLGLVYGYRVLRFYHLRQLTAAWIALASAAVVVAILGGLYVSGRKR